MIQANLDLAKDAYIQSYTEVNIQIVAIKPVKTGTLLASADSNSLYDLLTKLEADGTVKYDREMYGADAISVFTNYQNAGGCGLGVTPDSVDSAHLSAYSAVSIKPASEGGYYCPDLTFAHELGHNFGCYHDPDHVSGGVPMYAYGYGYDVLNTFGTIMSYDGPDIGMFSNPSIIDSASGLAIGDVSTADNARTIRENKLKISDNSEQISEALEDGDSETNYAIQGTLNTSIDRDAYIMMLEGDTRFVIDNDTYSNNPFYLNLYNETTHELISSFNTLDSTLVLPRAKYRVSFSFSSDETGSYTIL